MLTPWCEDTGAEEDDYEYTPLVDFGFLERRSDLRGLAIRAMTEEQFPYVSMTPPVNRLHGLDYTASGDKVKDVTNHSSTGIFANLAGILEREMNYSLTRIMRQDGLWGHKWPGNGSWSGMLSNLLKGEADFILGSFTLTPERIAAIDYLHPLAMETIAVYILNDAYEVHGWLSYLYPFRNDLWWAMMFIAIIVTIAYKSLDVHYGRQKMKQEKCKKIVASSLGDFMMIVSFYFGNRPREKPVHDYLPLRAVLFIVCLAGNYVFLVYRASLTAVLFARKYVLPFDSLIGLFQSDYRQGTTQHTCRTCCSKWKYCIIII